MASTWFGSTDLFCCMHTQVWTLCRIPGQKWKHITVWWRRTLSWQLCYCRWPWYPQFHTSAPDILRMMASLGFRSFLDSPIFWSIEIDMQGYHSTGVNLACDLNLTAPMFCMKHQWSKHSNTYDLRQHLGRRHRHICCFPDHNRCPQHFGAWSSCLCVFLFSSWRICRSKCPFLPQNLQIASLAGNLLRNEHLPYTRHRTFFHLTSCCLYLVWA